MLATTSEAASAGTRLPNATAFSLSSAGLGFSASSGCNGCSCSFLGVPIKASMSKSPEAGLEGGSTCSGSASTDSGCNGSLGGSTSRLAGSGSASTDSGCNGSLSGSTSTGWLGGSEKAALISSSVGTSELLPMGGKGLFFLLPLPLPLLLCFFTAFDFDAGSPKASSEMAFLPLPLPLPFPLPLPLPLPLVGGPKVMSPLGFCIFFLLILAFSCFTSGSSLFPRSSSSKSKRSSKSEPPSSFS